MDRGASVGQMIDDLIMMIDREYKIYTNFGTSERRIMGAESKLNIRFTEEFHWYLRLYAGLFIRTPKRGEKGPYNEYQFSSLVARDPECYTIIGETKKARRLVADFPPNAYVIQNVVGRIAYVIQLEGGDVYQIEQDGRVKFLADSFSGYLRSFLLEKKL